MNIFDLIHVGCAILSTSAEVAPFVKKYAKKKNFKRMTARKGFQQATVETDDESDQECQPTNTRDKEDKDLKPGVLKDLMSTIQAQSGALQEHSQVISHLVSERSSGLSSIPEDTKTLSNLALDDDFGRLSLGTNLQNFSFPDSENLLGNVPSSPMSRNSSFSMPNTSMPPSPATSYSSIASLSILTDDRRSSYTTSRHSSCSESNPAPPPSPSPSSRPRSFTNGSYQSANIGRRVSFGSPCSKVILHQNANQSKRQAAELFVEKALAASLPNKYGGSRRALPRNMSFPTSDLPLRSPWHPSETSLSMPIRIEHHSESHRSPSSSLKGSPPRSPDSLQRASINPRHSSYASQTKHRHSSYQSVLPPKIHQRPLAIPSKEQWRSSLKSSQVSASAASSARALSDDSDSSSRHRHPSSRQRHSSPTSNLQLARRQQSRPPSPSSQSFTSVLTQANLSNIQQRLNNIPLKQLTHYASTWSYNQTISQFLHPDSFFLKDVDMVHRSYLSSSIRSHIYLLAHTISQNNKQEGEEGNGCLAIAVFLLRLVMFFGIDILVDAPIQCVDSTGLRGLESSYSLAREMGMFLSGRGQNS